MCYFMGQKVSKDSFILLNKIQKELGTAAAFDALKDGFKYGDIAVIKNAGNNDFDIVNMHWEFIPPWIKNWDEMGLMRKGIDPKTMQRRAAIPWFNAKGETLLESRMFAAAARKRRCLVPASNFWEWRHYKPEGSKKDMSYPYNIQVKNAPYFFIAAIWQPWKHTEVDKETGEVFEMETYTAALITTEANEVMSQIHNIKKRMPAILPEALATEWLFGELDDKRITEIATYKIPSGLMEAFPVAKEFRILENPVEAYEYSELPALKLA